VRRSFDIVVAAAELYTRFRQNGFVVIRRVKSRLMRRRPYFPSFHIVDVAEGSPVVSGCVFTPSCESDVLPVAVTAASTRNHDVVSTVGQQLRLWRRCIWAAKHPN